MLSSKKKIKVAIDDNKRLSLKDYRLKIYELVKQRNRSNFNINNTTITTNSIYRIREKHSKPKTEASESKGKDGRKSSFGSNKQNVHNFLEDKVLP